MVTRRLALSSLFNGKARDTTPQSSPPPLPPATAGPPAWPWPSSSNSKNPRAQSTSTRAAQPQPQAAGARTTVASVVLDSADSSFTASSAARQDYCSDSLSTASEASAPAADDAVVVRGVRSDRLLFDPPGASATNSILEEKSAAAAEKDDEEEEAAFGGAAAVAFESADPYADFRASMEEMVAAHGVGDWVWLEQMLGWYLRANDGDTHCAIVAAFIDVVVAIADPAREACASSQTFAAGESLDVAEKKGKPPAGVLAVSCLD